MEAWSAQRVFLPFVALQQLAEVATTDGPMPTSLREVVTAGEQLHVSDVIRRFFQQVHSCRLHNHYGPSETHVVTTHKLEGPTAEWPVLPAPPDREFIMWTNCIVCGGPYVAQSEGPKAVGKTATALERARTIHRLDDPAQASLAKADPGRLVTGAPPVLIDEWQRVPEVWDAIRRAVDEDQTPGQFLITGSASPVAPPTHSGAGRIVKLRLRPFSMVERELETPTVSLHKLLTGRRAAVSGETTVDLSRYTEEIVASGFPAIRPLPARARRAQLESYIARVVDRNFEEMGRPVRKEDTLRRWIAAYAAATSTTATWEGIRNAATGGHAEKPARTTAISYRDTLQRLWILDPVPAWIPSKNYFSRLAHPEKHHLADPGLVTVLLGLDEQALLEGAEGGVRVPRDGTLLGHLFESLVTQSTRVYAQAVEASVKHLRTKGGRHEVDLIVERRDGRVLAIEVKLGRTVSDADARHLLWLKEKVGPDLLDAVIVNTGPSAYRRPDGVAVVPAALLGP